MFERRGHRYEAGDALAMRSIAVVGIVCGLAACSSSSNSSPSVTSTTRSASSGTTAQPHNVCWSAIDDLSNDLSAAGSTDDLDPAHVLASFNSCTGAQEWERYATTDGIGSELSGLGDTDGPFTAATARHYLCTRFDAQATSPTCKT